MNAIIRNIPNSVTCLNLVSGCMSIYCSVYSREALWGLHGWEWAAIFIGIAAVADFLDGFCARLLRAYSDLGKELDSLCDLVSFGVAPAMMLIFTLPSLGVAKWVALCSILIAVAGAIRLARFNIDTRQASVFIGLPIPSNAIFWIGFCGMVVQGNETLLQTSVFLPLLVFECWLMISPLKLFSLKFHSLKIKENLNRFILAGGSVVMICLMGVSALMWVVVFYILLSLALKSE